MRDFESETELRYKAYGYETLDGTEIVSSACIPSGKDEHGNAILERGLAFVPKSSLDMLREQTVKTRYTGKPTLADTLELMYNVAFGQRECVPTYQHTFLDVPIKTFFTNTYHPSFMPTTQAAHPICAYCNYIETRRWNDQNGIVERVTREWRYVSGTIAKLLLDGLDTPCGLKHSEIKRYALRHHLGTLDQMTVRSLRNSMGTDDMVLAFIDGIAFLCAVHDRSKSKSSLDSPFMRYARKRQAIIDGISMNPDEFYSAVNVKKICSLGNLSLDVMYVIPEDTERYGENPIDIMSEGCPRIDRTNLPFCYSESTLLDGDGIRMMRDGIDDEFAKSRREKDARREYRYPSEENEGDDDGSDCDADEPGDGCTDDTE